MKDIGKRNLWANKSLILLLLERPMVKPLIFCWLLPRWYLAKVEIESYLFVNNAILTSS